MNMQNLSKSSNTRPIREVEKFFILDFDRCLSDADVVFDLFEKIVAEQTDITKNDMINVREEVEQSGGSFSATGYVKERLLRLGMIKKWELLVESYVVFAQNYDTLAPGAQQLIDRLNYENLDFGILTYGDEEWQKIKLRASKFDDIPVIITDHKHKGYLLASWQRPDGKFDIPKGLTTDGMPMIAKKLVFVDDKATSFEGFPALNAIGFQVLPFDVTPVVSQLGSLPPNVARINSLVDIPV